MKSVHALYSRKKYKVAPVRERGLKFRLRLLNSIDMRRSREGAWIEMVVPMNLEAAAYRRSREGAWIEIRQKSHPHTQ